MKTVLKYVSLLFISVLFHGCLHKEVTCPDLDENILSWYPYNETSVIRLENKMTDTLLTIPVSYIRIQHTTHYNTGNDCGHCNDNIQIGNNAAGFNISVYIEKNKITSEQYNINGVSFDEKAIVSENYMFNNKEYERVKIFEKAGSSGKLIVARNFGIVGYIDENGEEWLLTESNPTQQLRAKITDTACE